MQSSAGKALITFAAIVVAVGACLGGDVAAQAGKPAVPAAKGGKMAFTLTSPAFVEGGSIPSRHTCDGYNLSPVLSWSGQPDGTKSFVLIVDDPDAPGGTFVHWVFFDIGAKTTSLPEGAPAAKLGVAGINDFGKIGWGGPCPPKGHGAHRYFFKLHALDIQTLELRPGATLVQLEQKIKGHVLASAQLMGRYTRR